MEIISLNVFLKEVFIGRPFTKYILADHNGLSITPIINFFNLIEILPLTLWDTDLNLSRARPERVSPEIQTDTTWVKKFDRLKYIDLINTQINCLINPNEVSSNN